MCPAEPLLSEASGPVPQSAVVPFPTLPRLRPRSRRLVVLGLVLLLVTPGAVSLERAMTYPGSASWQLRFVEWTRDHGGAPGQLGF